MAVTQAQIDALEAAIFSGERSVTFDGRTVIYRNLDEMQRILDTMRNTQAGSVQSAPDRLASRRSLGTADKDLGTPSSDPRLDWRS